MVVILTPIVLMVVGIPGYTNITHIFSPKPHPEKLTARLVIFRRFQPTAEATDIPHKHFNGNGLHGAPLGGQDFFFGFPRLGWGCEMSLFEWKVVGEA